jgi:hypothetical protein
MDPGDILFPGVSLKSLVEQAKIKDYIDKLK